MKRGPYLQLARALGDWLVDLGLAQQRPAGIGIGRAGREMVIASLLRTRYS